MVKKKTFFTVGLFVLIGVAAGITLIIWLGASQYLKKGKVYATYFDESVQGLQIDSNVKFRGVNIGMVSQINVAPDYRLIEVIMKINYAGDIEGTIAKLKTAGITGIVFVELDYRKDGDIANTPKITFTPDYPVIPSNPSEIKQIFAGIDSVIEQMKQIDFKGISDQLKMTTTNINAFVSGDEMKRIIKNLDALMANLEKTSEKLNKVVSDGRVDTILNDTRESIKKIKEEVNALNLAETSNRANQLIENASRKTKRITTELEIASENLKRTTENMDQLVDRLKADPSEIIFSNPPAKKR